MLSTFLAGLISLGADVLANKESKVNCGCWSRTKENIEPLWIIYAKIPYLSQSA